MSTLNEEGVVVIKAPEIFGIDFRDEFRKSMQGHPAGTPYEVDLQKVAKIESSALGMLLLLKEHADVAGRVIPNVSLKNAQPEVRKMLHLVNFQQLFVIS